MARAAHDGSTRTAPAGSQVLLTKLRPRAGSELVMRPRLIRLLDEEVRGPTTLVIAPAGSGKTSLVASWAASATPRTVWLSVDEADRDPARFLTDLVACLEGAVPQVGAEARALLAEQAPPAQVSTALLLAMGRMQTGDTTGTEDGQDIGDVEDVVLVLDDVDLACRDPLGGQLLAELAQFAPPWLHLVLIARDDLGLPVDRLRARGQLGEVRFNELRFSQEEAEELLAALAPELPAKDRSAAARRSGGWAVSLRLAAVAARSVRAQAPDAESAPPEQLLESQLVENYLRHEVLGAQKPAVVTVLQAAALVDRIDASLAVAMTGLTAAGAILEEAEARGLFLTRLDSMGWFGLHELVGAILATDLRSGSPERLAKLHAGAARWYESHQRPSQAVEHWFAAGSPREALAALTRATSALYDADLGFAMFDAVSRMPMSEVVEDTAAAVNYTWVQSWVDRSAFLLAVDQLVESSTTTSAGRELQGKILLLRATAALQRGDWDDVPALTERGLDLLGRSTWRDPIGRFAWNVDCRARALGERWHEASPGTRSAFPSMAVGPRTRLNFEATRALGEALAGHPVRALSIASQIRSTTEHEPYSAMSQELALAEAVAHRELGDRELALPILTELTNDQQSMIPYAPLLAWLELAAAHIADGLLDRARECLTRARQVAEADVHGAGIRSRLGVVATRIALAGGHQREAFAHARSIPDPFWRPVSTSRVLLADGDRDAARAALEAASAVSSRQAIVRDLLLSRTQPRNEDAERHALRAIEHASENGLLQTVADEGPDVLDRIEVLAAMVPEAWVDRLRRTVLIQTSIDAVRHESLTQLTTRERQVLRMLPGRLTVSEIAEELNITHNTVKFHLKVIYQKLGCSSRAEAAAIARSSTRIAKAPQ